MSRPARDETIALITTVRYSNIRIPCVVGLLLAGLVQVAACARKPAATVARPNIVIVLVDALRNDFVGPAAQWPITPHLDELAAGGVRFERTWTASTWTKPAIASLFTGLYPSAHGVHLVASRRKDRFESEMLDDSLTTLAERFQAAGWTTGGIVNQVHLSPRDGFHQGFDGYAHLRGAAAPGVNRQLRRWLDARAEEPFFAYVHYLDVHWPYDRRLETSAVPLHERILPGEMPPCVSQPRREHPECPEVVAAWLKTPAGTRSAETLRRRYAREVEFVDTALGELFAELRQRGLWERTIVVVTSDHGEGFGEHGHLQHGYMPWEEVARIPLLIRLPPWYEVAPGIREAPASLIDLYPTLLDLAELEIPPGLDGRSLVPLLRGTAARERILLIESPLGVAALGVAALDGGKKLLREATDELAWYDLTGDPGEQRPIPGPCTGLCARLARALDSDDHRLRVETRQRELRDDEIRELEALGYL